MGLKKKKKKRDEEVHTRMKGNSRASLVLDLVATDNTFFVMKVSARVAAHEHEKWIGKCIHCNSSLTVGKEGATNATVEHIMPLCAGGSGEDLKNMALACSRCNNTKGIHHDANHLDARAQEVVAALLEKRLKRWREP